MSEHDEHEFDGMGERQSPSPADTGTTDQDVAITGNEGTAGAERLGLRGTPGGLTESLGAEAGDDATSGVAGTVGTDTSSEGLLGAGIGSVDASETGVVGAEQGATDEQSDVLGTRGGTDSSDMPGGLAGGMDTGDVSRTGEQADTSQEGANIQP